MSPTVPKIERQGNRILIAGHLGLGNYRRLLATIHDATAKRGHKELVLDFEQCTSASSGPMLAVCGAVQRLRFEGVDTDLLVSKNLQLKNLFHNANWAYLIDPAAFEESTYERVDQVPTIPFGSPSEQQAAVNRLMNSILSTVPGLERSDLTAIEWALNEITDNVLTHAESQCGGFVQLNNHTQSKKFLEFIVADAGVGIPETMRRGHPEIHADPLALEQAMLEGVTRDKNIGQGNGLFGTLQIARISGGYMSVRSGRATMDYRADKFQNKSEAIPHIGTLVVAAIDLSRPDVLGEALRLNGTKHDPVSYVEMRYETENAERLLFKLREEATSFGSRVAGTPVRTKLLNLLKMHRGRKIVIDFDGIPLISSSFADEVFGKLFAELGALRFNQSFDFVSMQDTVHALFDRAIAQRNNL